MHHLLIHAVVLPVVYWSNTKNNIHVKLELYHSQLLATVTGEPPKFTAVTSLSVDSVTRLFCVHNFTS